MPGDDWPRDVPPVVARNLAGGLSVFFVGKNGIFYRIDQDDAGNWPARWAQMPGDNWPRDVPPVVARDLARGLSVFFVGKNGVSYRIDQDGAGNWPAGWADMGGGWSHHQVPAVALNRTGGLSVFLVEKDLHNLFRYDQNGHSGAWSIPPAKMGGDWSYDRPIVIGGSPYGGTSIFLVAKDEGGFWHDLLGGILGFLGIGILNASTGGLAGLFAIGGAVGGVYSVHQLDDALSGKPVLVRYDLLSPQIDASYMVMAPAAARPTRPSALQGTAVEAAFDFDDAVRFVDKVLAVFDRRVDQHVYPAGWLSLRVTGRTSALLGMQQFDRTGTVEAVLIGNPDDYDVIKELENVALETHGVLHWGQSNGLVPPQYAADRFGVKKATWSRIQQLLRGNTFRNHFMERCGL
jgi:hypothetical protein